MLQFKVPPIDENDSSNLEHNCDEKEADEGEEEKGGLFVETKEAEKRDSDLCEANSEHERGEVDPASFLVENAVIIFKGVRHDLDLQIVSNVSGCSL